MSKVLTVFGATGNQGGSVITAVLKHPKLSSTYKLRGITRDTSKPAAQALKEKGVEVVRADLNDKESLKAAIGGSSAVFAVTNCTFKETGTCVEFLLIELLEDWESASKETEFTQGKNIADTSAEAGVEHLIWSSLPHVTKSEFEHYLPTARVFSPVSDDPSPYLVTDGKLKRVEHFDSKAEVEEYMRTIKGMTSTFFMPGFFMQNIKGMIRPGPDGVAAFTMPWHATTTRVPLLDVVDDTGKFVVGILLAPRAEVGGKRIQGTSEWRTPAEIVGEIEKTGGKHVKFNDVPEEVFHGFLPKHMADELTENMVLVRDYKYFGPEAEKETIESAKILDQKPVTWKEFVESHGPW